MDLLMGVGSPVLHNASRADYRRTHGAPQHHASLAGPQGSGLW